MPNEQEITKTIIALESAALERWGNGDPSGFLEISAPDVVYFDPYQERRIDGIKSLTALYESIRGMVHVDRFELLNPLVQLGGELVVLTFNYVSFVSDKATYWNCTEVFRQDNKHWKIIQTHWSYTRHPGIVQN
jgi:ketosteroid isomerase-like protein